VNANGWISLGQSALDPSVNNASSSSYAPISSTTVITPEVLTNRISALARDLQSQAGGIIRLETIGAAPNRVCVVQWENYKKYGTSGTGDQINFQIRLHETSNNVSIVYGNIVSNATNGNMQVGLRGPLATDFNARAGDGSWNNTTAASTNSEYVVMNDVNYPADGLTFAFSYPVADSAPNPANLSFPADGATLISPFTTLNWMSGGGLPDGFKLSLGTNNPPTNIVNNLDLETANSYTPNPELSPSTTYFWKVVPYNAFGDAANCPVWSFTTHGDASVNALPYTQHWDAVTAPELPFDWSAIVNSTSTTAYVRTSTTSPYSAPNNIQMANSGDANAELYLISPQIHQSIDMQSIRVKAWVRPISASYVLEVGVMTNPTDPATFELVQTLTFANTTYTEHAIPLTTYTGTGRFIAFRHGLGGTYRTFYLDDITFEEIAANDMAAIALNGNTTPSVGTPANYTVTVMNNGTATQNTYAVKLFNTDDTELGSVAGPTIAGGETAEVMIPWTPTTEGPTGLYGKVVLTGDINATNDTSPVLNVSVQPEGIMSVTIGDGTEMQGVPWEFYYKNSLFQTLYFQNELGMFGNITAVSFYNNFTTDLTNMPVKLWMGTTNQEDLSAGWIDPTTLTLVYDGTMDFPSGANTITLPLQVPYNYAGGNLLLYANRPMDTQYYSSSDDFLAQTVGANRARKLQSDSTEYDPMAPSAAGTLSGTFPKTTFIMTPLSDDPMFAVSPSEKDFGDVILGYTPSQDFNVINVGGGTLGINNISISGDAAFTLSNLPTLPAQLNTGQTATFTVVYAPTSAGDHTATVTITDNQRETHTVELSGTGVDTTIYELSYAQGFDEVAIPALPLGWNHIYEATATTGYVKTVTTSPQSPPNTVAMYNPTDINTIAMLIAPPLANTIPTNNVRVKFWGKGNNYSLKVGVMTDPTDADTFTEIETMTFTSAWAQYQVSLASYTGNGQYIAFKHANNAAGQTIYIDTVEFEMMGANDLAALSITGNTTPAVDSPSVYFVSVYNNGTAAQDAYSVKLYDADDVELATVAGPAIAPGATQSVELSWTPTEQGLTSLYGKVILAGDINPGNDITANLNVNVTAADVFIVTLGTGTDVNGTSGTPTPYGTFYKNFRQQYLYTADDIMASGGVPGIIYAMAFDTQALNTISPMPNYRIRLKNTAQTELNTTFETGDYTQVWSQDNFMPEVGWNMHVFDAPFVWDGTSNILVDILTDLLPGNYTQNASVYYTPTANVSCLRYQSDSSPASEALTGTTSSNRANTRFYLTVDDMGSLTGTVTENGVALPNVNIQIDETVYSAVTNASGVYTFPYAPVGTHTVTASKPGYTPVSHTVTIVADQETVQNFVMSGTPEIVIDPSVWSFGDVNLGGSANKVFTISNIGGGALGITSITIAGSATMVLNNVPTMPATLTNEQSLDFGVTFTPNAMGESTATVTIIDDLGRRHTIGDRSSLRSTNTRETHTIALSGNGVNDITIGDGSLTGRYPMDFYWKNSLYETIYTADEMNNFIGMITGVKFYNNFVTDLQNMPTKVWLGSTTQTDLATDWIPSTDLTLVFDGTVNYPSGENVISITFPEAFMHLDGGNIVMMVNRPMDTEYYNSGDVFKTQTVGTNRSRNIQSDSTEYDPAAPTGGTISGHFPKTTFVVIPGGVGHISGTVVGADSAPLAGVAVSVDGRPYTTETNAQGEFYIANVLPGNYAVSFSRHGYVSQNIDIVLEEDETEVMDITMNLMAQVNVTGTILASDTGNGIAGANINLIGYENYSGSSTATGAFTIPAVFANQNYQYSISAAGYTSINGTINVGATNHNMGDMTLSEIAYAPNSVHAELNDSFNAINLSWNAPDPNAIEITEGFEATEFPPNGWDQTITNGGPANPLGVLPTWCNFGTINISGTGNVVPTEGSKQAGLWWDYEHQDEWLTTPTFNCPPDAHLSFDTYATLGSTNNDHYYVKITTDGGNSWTALWDASAQAAGTNYYQFPITVSLEAYAGTEVQLAFHAVDPPSNDGLWYVWFIDNLYIGNFVENIRFAGSDLMTKSATANHSGSGNTPDRLNRAENLRTIENSLSLSAVQSSTRNTDRALVGYHVWRLAAGQESNESTWVALTDEIHTSLSLEDSGWTTIPNGTYKWAVKAMYTAGVASAPAFSNPMVKEVVNGTIVGFVRRQNNQGIAGATVTAEGGYTTTTNNAGAYSLVVPAGVYSVTASAAGFNNLTYENITVAPNQNTTMNFIMTPTSNEDEVIPVTVTALNGNYPNPFNPETTISYDIKDAGNVRLDVFNVKGQLVRTLVNADQASGRYRVVFNGRDNNGNPLSSGIYLYRFTTGTYSNTRKMMLME
jgi:hypothetical protein